jgi:hypothetical protein
MAKTKEAPDTTADAAERLSAGGNDIPKTSLTSSVTSDLAGAPEDFETQQKAFDEQAPAEKAGIGLVKVDGVDFRYVGIAPARDEDPQTESGLAISPTNSTFTPLSAVPFHPSVRVKDPASGKFYFPQDGCTSWNDCKFEDSYLIPRD